MQSVILAAGRGLRLRPITESTPKALVDVCGRPLIAHILDALPSNTTEILIVVGHLRERIVESIGDAWNGIPVRYAEQETLDGTGSALHLLRDRLRGRFLVVNGDDLYARGDLERLVAHDLALLAQATDDDVAASVLRDETGRFEGFERAAPAAETKWRVCGAYALDERFFRVPLAEIEVRDTTEYSLPHTLVMLARDADIRVVEATDWTPVGTPDELSRARARCETSR